MGWITHVGHRHLDNDMEYVTDTESKTGWFNPLRINGREGEKCIH